MIETLRIIVAGKMSYDKAILYTVQEQQAMNIIDIFEDQQLAFKTKDKKIRIIFSRQLTCICLKRYPRKVGRAVNKLIISGEISFEGACIIPESQYSDLGIPIIFDNYKQIAFWADGYINVVNDYNIQMVVI